jgi:hypothetical protein
MEFGGELLLKGQKPEDFIPYSYFIPALSMLQVYTNYASVTKDDCKCIRRIGNF